MQSCPKDGNALVNRRVRQWDVFHCGQCYGLWLPPTVVKAVAGRIPQPELDKSTILLCPKDSSRLVAIRHEGVELDLCSACGGAWLDHGELERILQKKGARSAAVRDVAGDVVSNADLLFPLGEAAGEMLSSVLEFLGEALGGL